jgi:hypothetical protein
MSRTEDQSNSDEEVDRHPFEEGDGYGCAICDGDPGDELHSQYWELFEE